MSSSSRSSLSSEQKRIENDYRERYTGDLPKFLGMPMQALLIWLAARYPDLSDKIAKSNKHNPSVDNADNFITQAAGIGSGLFGYVIGSLLIKFNFIEYPKAESDIFLMSPDNKEDKQESDIDNLRLYKEEGQLTYYYKGSKQILEGIKYPQIIAQFDKLEPKKTRELKCDVSKNPDAQDECTKILEETSKRGHTKKQNKLLNPSYRVFKTLSVIAQMIGNIALIPIIFIDKASQRLEMGFSAAIIGSFSVVVTPFLQWVKKYFKSEEIEELFKVAHDGWSKFMRTALYWGMCLGGIFGPFFLGHGSFNNLNTAVTYSGALGGLTCCALSLIFVPLINYVSKRNGSKARLSYPSSGHLSEEELLKQKDEYRDNYFRAGISIFLAIGAIGFSLWGLTHGIPTDELLGYAAWGGSIGGAVGGLGFARLGRTITQWINKAKTYNPWDFILANTGILFGYAGVTLGIVGALILFPGDPLSAMALGSCLGKAGGNLFGVMLGCYWNSAPEEGKTEEPPWTQRMLLAANRYGILGAFLGVGVGFGIYFLCPMLIACPDLSLFTLLAASTSIGTSTFAFIGGIRNCYNAAPVKLESDQVRLPGVNHQGIRELLPESQGSSEQPLESLKKDNNSKDCDPQMNADHSNGHNNSKGCDSPMNADHSNGHNNSNGCVNISPRLG